ncbi:hypothetical protein FPQ18DRAFT_306234 [Pyronema domesticum]|nr:hypothetical protein FPQ18DRAFT_306234 [Pyronema domesticum]
MSSEVHFPFSQVYSIHRIANPFEQLSVSGTPRRPNPPPGIEYHDSRVNIVLGRFSQSQDIHMWWALGDAESLKKIEARCRYWYATLLDSWEDERDIPPKLSQFIYDRLKRQKGMFMCFELDLDLARKKLARNGGVFVSNNKESESEEEMVRVVLMKEKGKEKGKEGTEEKEEVEVKDGKDTEEEIQPTVKKALKLGKQSFSSIDDEYLWERPRPTAAPLPAPPAPAPQPSAAEAQAAQATITAAVNAERLRQSTFKAEQGPSYDPRHHPPRGRDRSRDRDRRRSRSRSRDRGRYRTWHRHDYVDLDRERKRSRSPDKNLKRSGSPPPRPKTPPKKYDDGYIHPSRMAPARTPSPDNVDMANMVIPVDSGMDEIHMSRYYGFLDHA